MRFFKNVVNGYLDEIKESSPISDLARTRKFQSKELIRINIFILTDGVSTLDHVEQVLKWDKQHKWLQDFEYAFMEKVANGVLPLSEKYQKIVWMNIQKVKRGGFVFA